MIRRLESFNTYGTSTAAMLVAQWAQSAGSLQAGLGRLGRFAYRLAAGNTQIARITYNANLQTVFFGVAVNFETALPSGDTASHIACGDRNNNDNCTLVFAPDGAILVKRGGRAGTVIATTAPGVFAAGGYAFLEAKITASNTSGAVELRVNGVTVLNATGLDNVEGSNFEEISMLTFGNRASGSGGANYLICDLAMYDDIGDAPNDFVGDAVVLEDLPDADGAENDWTPSAGSDAWAVIDETPADGDTSYIESSTPGDRQTVTFPALDPIAADVVCVSFQIIARKTDPGDGSVSIGAISNGTEDQAAGIALSEAYIGERAAWANDPDTSAPWTVARAGDVTLLLERTL